MGGILVVVAHGTTPKTANRELFKLSSKATRYTSVKALVGASSLPEVGRNENTSKVLLSVCNAMGLNRSEFGGEEGYTNSALSEIEV